MKILHVLFGNEELTIDLDKHERGLCNPSQMYIYTGRKSFLTVSGDHHHEIWKCYIHFLQKENFDKIRYIQYKYEDDKPVVIMAIPDLDKKNESIGFKSSD